MSDETFAEFRERREHGNKKILAIDNKVIKRFISLDSACYRDGALPGKTKELLGLVASMVLRCNDCIDYHLEQCTESGFSEAELEEAMSVALVVGGSIVIPHMRHARLSMDALAEERDS